jgi:mannonate dehydratase
MSFRWFGSKVDPIPLRYIRQIPGVEGVVTTLYDLKPGEEWPVRRIRDLKEEVRPRA